MAINNWKNDKNIEIKEADKRGSVVFLSNPIVKVWYFHNLMMERPTKTKFKSRPCDNEKKKKSFDNKV